MTTVSEIGTLKDSARSQSHQAHRQNLVYLQVLRAIRISSGFLRSISNFYPILVHKLKLKFSLKLKPKLNPELNLKLK
ncbi:unnamed protein product, partial [Nesidiocoris tenuis]